MVRRSGVLRSVSAGLAAVLSGAVLTLVPTGTASAALPLCTHSVNVNRNGNNLAVPAANNGSLDCLIGARQAANSAIVRDLQYTLKTCYPTVRLASPYQNERVGNLGVDGSFGPRTHAAVKGVQSAIGTGADGVYGPNTRNAMRFTSNDVPGRCHHF